MKKLFTLFWGLLSALSIQAQSDFPIQFADKDGNIIDNEATLVLTEYGVRSVEYTALTRDFYLH